MSQLDSVQSAYLQQIVEIYQQGDLQNAKDLCQQCINSYPANTIFWQFLGFISIDLKDYPQAICAFEQADQLDSQDPFLWSGLAQSFEAFGDSAQAMVYYQKALSIDSMCIDALLGIAPLLQTQKNYGDALNCYQMSLQQDPNSVDILSNMAGLYLEMGQFAEAIVICQKALTINPVFAATYYNMGIAYKSLNRIEEAIQALEAAIHYQPGFAEAYFQLGILYKLQGQYEDELRCYETSVSLQPHNIPLQMRLALIYSVQGKIKNAENAYQQLQQLEPENPLWSLRLASLSPIVVPDVKAPEAYRDQLNKTLDVLEQNKTPFAVSDLGQTFAIPPYHWLYHGLDDTQIRSRFADYLYQRMEMDDYAPKPRPLSGRKIKVGFLCTENREHSFWALQGGFIQKLNPQLFDVFVIGTAQTMPALKERIVVSNIQFIDLPITISDIVTCLRDAQMDVIHFFEVGSDSKNYLLPFYRMAPVQCTSWGILSTTGIPNMDYYLSSVWFEASEAQAHYRETLVTFNSSLAYYSEPVMPDTFLSRQALGLPEDKTLYASPHNLFKFQPDIDNYFIDILNADPKALIVLNKTQNPIIFEDLQARLKHSMGSLYSRVLFLEHLPWREYTSLISASDVLLDPLHFGGGITSYNAFAIGKPVITQPTSYLRGRITAGMYRMMGIDECIVDSKQAYVDTCVEIANNKVLQASLSDKILKRKQVLFCDEKMVKELETFLLHSVEQTLLT